MIQILQIKRQIKLKNNYNFLKAENITFCTDL